MNDGRPRCWWAEGAGDLMRSYHDAEWGAPLHDDRRLFELLILEGAQAGLSWSTILNKRENYRRAFEGFDPRRVSGYGAAEKRRLMGDPGIVRNAMKIDSAVTNARAFLEVQREFGTFDAYLWGFTGGRTLDRAPTSKADVPSRTGESDALSRDLGRRGFRFVGSTIVYAYMQSAGLVNDHVRRCFRRAGPAPSRGRSEVRTRRGSPRPQRSP